MSFTVPDSRLRGEPDVPQVDPGPLRLLINGLPTREIPVWDRGLSYGDGLFETILIRGGAPCQWSRHLARLEFGCRRLRIPYVGGAVLAAEARALTQGADGVLKILITRGAGGRGYRPLPLPCPRRALLFYPLPGYPVAWSRDGVILRWCATPASQNRALAGIKHLNRLDSVLARAEWDDPAVAEGLMLREDGRVVGGTMTNLFLWTGQSLITPILDRAGIAGTVRALTLELAVGLGIACRECHLNARDLRPARGLFLTNALIGCWPVRQLDGQDYAPHCLPWELLEAVALAASTAEWPTT
ncbi:MAG: aminodeoxychorismate lyase [Lamprocystis purpurea]|jgi:4-amino-4-deoxychorismate lyase|uniref:aminodeoxychorismate lyase n=1 Tax=Lamprocystis purpurea TaxID=61598 RepID=UPI0012FA653B|nr:aminodeoxychorismate lyase [Lamprocystis purpurea]MBV5272279.1 aminodeoxychorismate lyase [Lamprocystis purpurea]